LDEFVITSADNDCALEFFQRLPNDRSLPVEYVNVKLTRQDLFAAALVWMGYEHYFSSPLAWFSDLANLWTGWEGERTWESIEHGLRLSAVHDRRGHVKLDVTLRSGFWENDWLVRATVQVEAGQLERMARHAASFFGKGFTP